MIAIATAEIWTWNRDKLTDAVGKLNKRATKLGVAPYVVSFGAERKIYHEKRDGSKEFVGVMVVATIEGVAVCVAGWQLVAKYDFMGEAGVIVSKSPGAESLEVDRDVHPSRCDHCRTSRRRAVSYLVQNESGARKIVGSSCLPDFTGLGRNAECVLALGFEASNLLADDDENDGGGYSRGFRGTDLVELLAATALAIRTKGWCSRKRSQIEDTAASVDVANLYLDLVARGDRQKLYDAFGEDRVTRTDLAVAKRSIHWCTEQSGNDYLDNLATLANAGWCTSKHEGLAASMVAAWQRHRGDLNEKARRIQVNPDAVAGAVGDKIATYVEVVRKRYIEGDWGCTTQVVMTEVATGATIVWWASGDTDDFVERERVQMAATIKKIDAYKGTQQTIVTRASALRHSCAAPKPERPSKTRRVGEETERAARANAVYYGIDPNAEDRDQRLAAIGVMCGAQT